MKERDAHACHTPHHHILQELHDVRGPDHHETSHSIYVLRVLNSAPNHVVQYYKRRKQERQQGAM